MTRPIAPPPIRRRHLLLIAAAGAALTQVPSRAAAKTQEYPVKPIRIIVPYGPGGTGDVIARLVGLTLTKDWGQPVIVENRGGAVGVIGATEAARSPPDGYTLLLGYTSELVISPAVIKGVSYVTDRDFRPVAFAGATPLLLIANSSGPARTLAEFVAAAKAKPGNYTYATAGRGSPADIAGALLARSAGITLLPVPYKGGSEAAGAVLAGTVSVYFSGIPPALPLIKSGRVIALGVASSHPAPALPGVPALALGAYPQLDLSGWFGFLAPAATPQPIVEKLNSKLVEILQSPSVKARLLELGVETTPMSTTQFGEFVKVEQKKYVQLLKSLDIQPE